MEQLDANRAGRVIVRRGDDAEPGVRRWPWRLGFGLAIVHVWVWMGIYFMAQALGSMDACYGSPDPSCMELDRQTTAAANIWGEVFAACSLVASVLGIAAAEGRRPAAAALVIFSAAVAAITFPYPSWTNGLHTSGFMAVGLAPFFGLAAWRLGSGSENSQRVSPRPLRDGLHGAAGSEGSDDRAATPAPDRPTLFHHS